MREEEILKMIQKVQCIENKPVALVGSKKALSLLPIHIKGFKPSVDSYPTVWNGYRCVALDTDLLEGGDECIYITPIPIITTEMILGFYFVKTFDK